MSRTKEAAIKGYLKIPRSIRKYVDPLIKRREKPLKTFEESAEQGKLFLINLVKKRLK